MTRSFMCFLIQALVAGLVAEVVHWLGTTDRYEFIIAGTLGYAVASLLGLAIHYTTRLQ